MATQKEPSKFRFIRNSYPDVSCEPSFCFLPMKDTLFIGATHGDESIGVRALQSLEQRRKDFDWLIGNPRAFASGVRFTDADLNRSAPGDASSAVFEKRRAAEILDRAKSYATTIDLHGTVKDTGLFLIITNQKPENLKLAANIDVKRVVLWPAITPDLKSPLSEFFPTGLEIECGPMGAQETQVELERVINAYLDEQPVTQEKEFYQVYGELRGNSGVPLKEFEEVTISGETFFPLLVSVYADAYGVACYKLRKV